MLLKSYETDVLVIGGGGAGLRAALAAAEAGSAVMIVNKGPVSRSGITLTAAGGMQAPFHNEDSAEQYFQDTLRCVMGWANPGWREFWRRAPVRRLWIWSVMGPDLFVMTTILSQWESFRGNPNHAIFSSKVAESELFLL